MIKLVWKVFCNIKVGEVLILLNTLAANSWIMRAINSLNTTRSQQHLIPATVCLTPWCPLTLVQVILSDSQSSWLDQNKKACFHIHDLCAQMFNWSDTFRFRFRFRNICRYIAKCKYMSLRNKVQQFFSDKKVNYNIKEEADLIFLSPNPFRWKYNLVKRKPDLQNKNTICAKIPIFKMKI